MREILFRGKRVRNGEWIYGSLIAMDSDIASSQVFIFPPYKGASSLPCSFLVSNNMEDVDPETVGQYTGLTDKNGKKIFEGDILEYRSLTGNGFEEVKNAVVFWDEHRWSYRTVYNNRWSNNWRGNERCDIYRHIVAEFGEVIGNIHDNPELLGGANNGE